MKVKSNEQIGLEAAVIARKKVLEKIKAQKKAAKALKKRKESGHGKD